MSNLGPQWEDDEDYSPARMDAKTIVRDTGTNIVAIASSRQLGAVCPTDTSAGLIKDVLYVAEYDGSFERVSFKPVLRKHTHSANTDEEGGTYMAIKLANTASVAEINMTTLNLSDWKVDAVGTSVGGLTYNEGSTTGRLKFDAGSTTNNCFTGSMGGVRITFTDIIIWQSKIEFNANTNLLTRIGVNVDRVDETQSTSRRQLGIEGCDGHGVNLVIINANGNSASLHVQATTTPILNSPTGLKNYKLIELPSNEVRLYENGVSTGVSTTNVAFDSDSDGLRLIRAGIKTTSNTNKFFYMTIMRMLANPGAADFS